jgi:hypothetical protein
LYVGLLIGAAFADAAVGFIKSLPHIALEVAKLGQITFSEWGPSAVADSIRGTPVKLLDTEGEPGDDLEKVRKSEEKRDASHSIVVQLLVLSGMLPKMQSFFNDEGTLNTQKIETIVPGLKTTFEGMFSDHSTSMKIKSVTISHYILPNVSTPFPPPPPPPPPCIF